MFPSFFFAGYECATGYNSYKRWIDQIEATHHDLRVREDYSLLRGVGIRVAREGVRWPLVDRGRGYDFSTIDPVLSASGEFGITPIWDLFHYGYPIELDLFSPQFIDRFTSYCAAAAEYIASRSEGPVYFTPVNEPSYFAYAAGDKGFFAPYLHGRGWDLKVRLCEATIKGIDAIRSVCPSSRIVNVDPVCRVAAPNPERQEEADDFNNRIAYQSFDMIGGKLLPELGGSREHLDIVGVNYYPWNQWELGDTPLTLAESDPRRAPLRDIIRDVWKRYGGQLLISETSDTEHNRERWLRYVVQESAALRAEGVPLEGVCIYPVLGMPDWHEPGHWIAMGLWDLDRERGTLDRVPQNEVLDVIISAQHSSLFNESVRAAA